MVAFDHNIRSSVTPSWMNKHGETEAPKQIKGGNKVQSPAAVVHNDYTITSAPQRLKLLAEPPKANDTWARTHGDMPLVDPCELEALMSRRYMFVNLWRNISEEPVQDMPLAMCDATSVVETDLVTFEIRYADRTGENYFARHSPSHRWVYYPLMVRDEAVLLKVWDSAGNFCQPAAPIEPSTHAQPSTFCLHSAFKDPAAAADCPRRESIEVRTVVFF